MESIKSFSFPRRVVTRDFIAFKIELAEMEKNANIDMLVLWELIRSKVTVERVFKEIERKINSFEENVEQPEA